MLIFNQIELHQNQVKKYQLPQAEQMKCKYFWRLHSDYNLIFQGFQFFISFTDLWKQVYQISYSLSLCTISYIFTSLV